ncbi:MAG: rhomboid family intramembrane serine protease [Myxococcota bacterium]
MVDLRRQWLAAIAHLVTKTEPPARLLALRETGAALAMADGSLASIVSVDGDLPQALADRLRKIVDDNPHAHLKHVVVGGDPGEVRALLKSCQPRLSMRRAVQVFHLGRDGEVWAGPGGREDSPVGVALTAAACAQDPPTRADVEALVDPPKPPSPEQAERMERGQRFIDRVRAAKPRAVWFMLATLGFVYALEALWGGGESAPTLVRMGANTDASLTTEPWRLLSSVLLHAGFAHAAINAFVLVMLGGFLERLIGPARLVILLVVSGLGGSIASAIAGQAALSVGASGAIWGALGASGVFALKPNSVIPEAVVPSIRRAAIINLVINLTVSFLPQVDLWAHLGGGIVGAELIFTGLLTRGLPRADATETAPGLPGSSRGIRIAAVASVVALGSGLAAAWVHGRPWQLGGDPVMETRTFGDGGVSMRLPSYMPATESFQHHGLDAYAVGDIFTEPFAVVVVLEPHQMSPAEKVAAQHEVASADPPPPPGSTVIEPWGPSQIGVGAYAAQYGYDNGLRIQMWYQVQDQTRIRVDTTWWSDATPEHVAAAAFAVESAAQ